MDYIIQAREDEINLRLEEIQEQLSERNLI